MTWRLLGAAAWEVDQSDQDVEDAYIVGTTPGSVVGNRLDMAMDGEAAEFNRQIAPTKTFRQTIVENFSSAGWGGAANAENGYAFFFGFKARVLTNLIDIRHKVTSGDTGKYTIILVDRETVGNTDRDTSAGTTEFDFDHTTGQYDIRIYTDGTDIMLDVDTGSGYVEECRLVNPTAVMDRLQLSPSNESSSNTVRFGVTTFGDYDNASERKGTPATATISPNGNTSVQFTDYDVEHDPADFQFVDEWPAAALGTDFDSCPGADEDTIHRQSYQCEGYTVVNDLVKIRAIAMMSADVAGKANPIRVLVCDGTNTIEGLEALANTETPTEAWGLFQTAPDGTSAWTTTNIGTTQLGVRSTQTADPTIIEVFSIYAEVFDFPDDPPPVTDEPGRRHLVQVIG